MMRWLLSLALLAGLAQAQGLRPFGVAPAVASGSWTYVAYSGGQSGQSLSLSCASAVCTLTTTSTGSAHGLLLGAMTSNGSGITINSITGGCASWVIDASAHKSNASIVDINGAYCLSSSAGSTSTVVTFSSAPAGAVVVVYEGSWSGSSISHDTTASTQNASSGTPAGQALTLAGTDFVLQFIGTAAGGPTTITSPYDTHFNNLDGTGSGGVLSFTGSSVAITASGTAPTWTNSANAASFVSAISLKGN